MSNTVPTSPIAEAPGQTIDRITAAATMFGTGSKQHLAAMKRWAR